MSHEVLLQSDGIVWTSGHSQANGSLRLFADRLEWKTGFTPLHLKPVPDTAIPIADVTGIRIRRAGLGAVVDLTTADQTYEFMLRRGWNPFAIRSLATTWLTSIESTREAALQITDDRRPTTDD